MAGLSPSVAIEASRVLGLSILTGLRRALGLCLALAATGPTAQPAASAAPATGDVPYAVLYRALEPTLAMRRYPRLAAIQRVESKLPGIDPASIRIRIGDGASVVVVPVARDGAMEFPLDAALLAANPAVRTNQPAGSLTLSVTLALRVPEGARIPVAAIREALAEADALMASGIAGAGPQRARGAEFRFARDAAASLSLRGAVERLLVADREGRIVLMRDPDLQAPAGLLEFSTAPLLVLPWMGR
jgi:hypothetical protein